MFKLWLVASILFGAVFCSITIFADSTLLRSQPYGVLIIVKSFAMLLTLLCYVVVRIAAEILIGGSSPTEAWRHGSQFISSPLMRVALLYVWVTAVALNFVRQMAAMVGARILANLMLGRYRFPKEETRIFMFLDMEGSTSIAERLGHTQFCQLIQESFRDLGEVAIRRSAEIYQYVGDEAILTWNPSDGLRHANCVYLFFDFEKALRAREEFYLGEFGVTPQFKAGLNIGQVTAAEIGLVRRSIEYLSDVLNTAARLQAMCRSFNTSLLITESLQQRLPNTDDLTFQAVGSVELKGKAQPVEVLRVDCPNLGLKRAP